MFREVPDWPGLDDDYTRYLQNHSRISDYYVFPAQAVNSTLPVPLFKRKRIHPNPKMAAERKCPHCKIGVKEFISFDCKADYCRNSVGLCKCTPCIADYFVCKKCEKRTCNDCYALASPGCVGCFFCDHATFIKDNRDQIVYNQFYPLEWKSDKRWHYGDANFITRAILPLDSKTAILVIDIDDRSHTNIQRIAFRTYYTKISDDGSTIEMEFDQTVTVCVNASKGGSLETIEADFYEIETGEKVLWIVNCYNYVS